jgi:F-type H+-transporting ATPase subunit epsilon
MADTFFLEIVTPDKKFFSDDVEMLVLNTPDGEIGILSNHMPLVVAVSIGTIRVQKDGKWLEAVLSEGFLEFAQEKAIIFVDTAEWPDEIDANRAKAAAERAQERLERQLSNVEFIRSQAALQRAMARLKVKNKRS